LEDYLLLKTTLDNTFYMTQKLFNKKFLIILLPVILVAFILFGYATFTNKLSLNFLFNTNSSSSEGPLATSPRPHQDIKPDEKGILVKFEQDIYTLDFILNLEKPDRKKFNDYYFNKYGLVILKNEGYDAQKAQENYVKNKAEMQRLFHQQIPNFTGKDVKQLIDHLVNIKLITYPDKRNANPELIAKSDKEDISDILSKKDSSIVLEGGFSNINSEYFYFKKNKILAQRGLFLDQNLDYSSSEDWNFLYDFTNENRTNFQYYVADRMKPDSVLYFNFDLGFMIHGIECYSLDNSITDENDRLDLIKKMAQDVRLSQDNPNAIFEGHLPPY